MYTLFARKLVCNFKKILDLRQAHVLNFTTLLNYLQQNTKYRNLCTELSKQETQVNKSYE